MVEWWMPTSALQLQLLGLAFILCAFIGLERQFRQKAAGFRTHVLVGTGSAAFTLVSAFGFAPVLGDEVVLDPSRIAAQIVSGIGFLGAGVIFTRKSVIRGLTTAATIWVAAAVGMAAGAGMPSLAIGLTAAHLVALLVFGPIVSRIPTRDSNRVIRITYADGRGALRKLLQQATFVGYSAYVLGTQRLSKDSGLVEVDIRFNGRGPIRELVPLIHEVDGVRSVRLRDDSDHEDDQNA